MSGFRWIVADGVMPRPGAREALEAAAARMPDARVLACRVPDGPEPWPELFARERAIDAARARLLAVRAVPPGALLVRDDVPAGSGLRWSAGVLRDGGGYLVPDAVADWPGAPRIRRREHLRLAAAPGLTVVERLWQAYLAVARA